MVNFSLVTAEIGSLVWGTSANFSRFRVLASLLLQRGSPQANPTLHDVWASPGLVHYNKLERGPVPNEMAALPNIGGALCSTPQSLADAHCWSTVQ